MEKIMMNTIYEKLSEIVKEVPDKTAVTDSDCSFSVAEFGALIKWGMESLSEVFDEEY